MMSHRPYQRPPALLILVLAVGLLFPATISAQEATSGPSVSVLDGTWLVRELDEEDAEVMLQFSAGNVEIIGFEAEDEEIAISFSSIEGNSFVFEAAVDDKTVPLRAVLMATHTAVFFTSEDDDLMLGRRVGELPEGLIGEWEAVRHDGRPFEIRKIVIAATGATLYGGAGMEWPSTVYPLEYDGGAHEIGLIMPDEGDTPVVFQYLPLDNNTALVWQAGDDDHIIVYRVGMRPDWMPEAPAEGSGYPTGSEPGPAAIEAPTGTEPP